MGKFRYNTKTFIEKSNEIHNNKYDYSKTNYISGRLKVLITCPKHGDFELTASSHLSGQGCMLCYRETIGVRNRKTTELFIADARKVHGNKYDYSNVNYTGKENKVEIICPIHGSFYLQPHNHLSTKSGCPKCLVKNQTLLFERLKTDFPNTVILFEVEKTVVPWIKRQRFDIYFPDYNIAVEYDGKQHYESVYIFDKRKEYLNIVLERDRRKEKLCKENNCNLFRIKYNYTEKDYQDLIIKIKNLL